MFTLVGSLLAVLIGLTLGLLGSGGSILTVPILVYLFKVEPLTATAYSLFIVGTTSLVGSFNFYKKRLVDIKAALTFAAPALVSVFAARTFIIPRIPEVVLRIGNSMLTKKVFIMELFAVLMIAASVSMIKNKREEEGENLKFNKGLLFIQGIFVGVLTGMVGAGGGFLIVPTLVLLARLPIKMAVGTSLMIISVNSLIGFTGDVFVNANMDWIFLFSLTILSVIGIFIGSYLSKFVSSSKLKPAFGWFVLMTGVYIMIKEFYSL